MAHALIDNLQRARLKDAATRLPHRIGPHRHHPLDRLFQKDIEDTDPERARAHQSMKQLWREAGGYFPNARRMPTPEFFSKLFFRGAEAETTNDGSVRWPRQSVRRLLDHSDPYNDYSEATLLHEWAHSHQSPRTLLDEGLTEGGAEAWAWALTPLVLARAGRSYNPETPNAYPGFMRDVIRHKGPDWILRGQFGR